MENGKEEMRKGKREKKGPGKKGDAKRRTRFAQNPFYSRPMQSYRLNIMYMLHRKTMKSNIIAKSLDGVACLFPSKNMPRRRPG